MRVFPEGKVAFLNVQTAESGELSHQYNCCLVLHPF